MKLKKISPVEEKTLILLGIFSAALILANLLGTKVATLFGVAVSVGIFAYPFSFVCTDIIEEVRGKKVARQFVRVGMLILILSAGLVSLSVALPPAGRYADNEAFTTVFASSLRMILASLLAFVMAQYHDIWMFSFWKRKTKGRFLWLRNNLSTVFSQLIDSTVFMFIAFYHVTPKFTAGFIVSLILPYWAFKVLFAILDTPLVYWGVRWLRGEKK